MRPNWEGASYYLVPDTLSGVDARRRPRPRVVSRQCHCCSPRDMSRAGLWSPMYDYMRVQHLHFTMRPFPCPARATRPPPRASRSDSIPDAARWPTTHGRIRYAAPAARTKPSGSRRLRPPRGRPLRPGQTRGGTAGAGPARGGWPLPACGEPMRASNFKVQTASNHALVQSDQATGLVLTSRGMCVPSTSYNRSTCGADVHTI